MVGRPSLTATPTPQRLTETVRPTGRQIKCRMAKENGRARRPWPAGRARRAVPAAHRAAYRAICPGLDADLGPTHNCGLQTPEDYGLNTDTTADRLGYGLTTDKSLSPYLLQASSTATRFWCGASGAHVNSTDCVRLTRASLRSLFSNAG